MVVSENKTFTKDYLDPEKRSIANTIQIFFEDGTSTEEVVVEYPIGHKRRREEGIPVLVEKFKRNLGTQFNDDVVAKIMDACQDQARLEALPVNEFMDLFV